MSELNRQGKTQCGKHSVKKEREREREVEERSKVELPVKTRSRDSFHGIIKMFVDVDGARVVGWVK